MLFYIDVQKFFDRSIQATVCNIKGTFSKNYLPLEYLTPWRKVGSNGLVITICHCTKTRLMVFFSQLCDDTLFNSSQNLVHQICKWSDARVAWNFLSLKGFMRTRVNKTRDFYSMMAIWSLWNPTLRNYRSDSGSYRVLFCPCSKWLFHMQFS